MHLLLNYMVAMKQQQLDYVEDCRALRSVALIVIRITVTDIFPTVTKCFCRFASVAAFCIAFTEIRACKTNIAAPAQACA